MKVVLDTNILVSAFAIGGKPARILDLVVDGKVEGVTSERLISELTRILGVKFGFNSQQLGRVESIVRTTFVVVNTPPNLPTISRDPDDDHVLAVAKIAKTDFIVSGDKDLLVIERYLDIPIITSTEVLEHIIYDNN
ncbi:MAG: putative toxin-antitoxin system toxin component, PIN family [Candidatus Berkelbacteria bacterium]|nr:putative toxin-antitoxin system toxin component, PIN family [Candidatus Berkelbacteria bacterium]MCR4307870.1 putative toxin-antitoxin system toxin component, PIN family [Candidatus Berkelbacteria bacterium]